MRVVDITEFWSSRGDGIRGYLTERARCLSRLGVQHTIVAPGDRDAELALGESRLILIAGPTMPCDPSCRSFGSPDTLTTVLGRLRADVIEAHSPFMAAFAALQVEPAASVRTMFWHGDAIATQLVPWISRFAGQQSAHRATNPLWASIRTLTESFDAVFVNSGAAEGHLRAHGIGRAIRLPLGIERDVFRPEARSAGVRRVLLGGTRPARKLVVASGSLVVQNRWEIIIEAMARVQQRQAARLVVVGDGPERDRLEAMALLRDVDALFIGFEHDRQRLATLLASSDALIHTDSNDGYCQTVADSLSAGLPVVVSEYGGSREWPEQRAVRHYAAGNAEDCAQQILAVLCMNRATSRSAAVAASEYLPTFVDAQLKSLQLYATLRRQSKRASAAELRFPWDGPKPGQEGFLVGAWQPQAEAGRL